jgi:CRISPR-associated protein Cmr2
MATYLLTLSLGPVQSMIEAARRTRDLWCGSWLLAECAKAAALVLHQQGCLIFPYLNDAALQPSDQPKDDDANIANILRAELELVDEKAVRALVDQAKTAASSRLAALCERARRDLDGLPFHEDLWAAQKWDILECFAAWVEVKHQDYAAASERLGGLLAARKATRDFMPAATTANGQGFGIPKSSLDGARESVINVPRHQRQKHQTALRKLGMRGGEELDALAVAKRRAGEIEQFTAYSRIAADAWIETLPPAQQQNIAAAYEPLVKVELATRVKGNAGIYQHLPYDAQLVFGFRLDNANATASATEKPLLQALRHALHGLDEPVPYAVLLKADGDRMGELLGRAKTAQQSRQISHALHGFAQSVRGIVRQYRGHAIYAGGDDVLALLPLESAVDCAAALADAFKAAMNDIAEALGVPATERPTLSVGLGIGHLVEPLGRLRARADEAEQFAKGNSTDTPRNALSIQLGIRSGLEIRWRCRWNEGAGNSADCEGVQALKTYIAAYRAKTCPSRLSYELRERAARLSWAKAKHTPLPDIHAAELSRTLSRARQRDGESDLPLDLQTFVTARAQLLGLAALADELMIARWLSARTAADIGSLD